MYAVRNLTPYIFPPFTNYSYFGILGNALTEARMVRETPALCRKSSPFRTLLNDCQKCNTQNNTFLSSTLLSDFAPYLDYCASLQNSDENEPDENEPDENEPNENEGGSSNSKPTSTSRPGETTFSGNEVILLPTPTAGPTGRDSPCYNDCSKLHCAIPAVPTS
jgi:hypothetical protein